MITQLKKFWKLKLAIGIVVGLWASVVVAQPSTSLKKPATSGTLQKMVSESSLIVVGKLLSYLPSEGIGEVKVARVIHGTYKAETVLFSAEASGQLQDEDSSVSDVDWVERGLSKKRIWFFRKHEKTQRASWSLVHADQYKSLPFERTEEVLALLRSAENQNE